MYTYSLRYQKLELEEIISSVLRVLQLRKRNAYGDGSVYTSRTPITPTCSAVQVEEVTGTRGTRLCFIEMCDFFLHVSRKFPGIRAVVGRART